LIDQRKSGDRKELEETMSVTDNGPDPNAFDIETKTVANENY
jgi:hypothetical protein